MSGARWQVIQGDCRDVLAGMAANSVDAVVCDPPYDLTSEVATRRSALGRRYAGTEGARRGFMGKEWDGTGVAFDPATWEAVLRVLKPGGYLLAFGGTRTSHRMVTAIEDAGAEIRDSIIWLYATGFPKSHNLPGGIGTALKPAHEPICLTRKPLVGTVAATVAAWGTGGLNIDGCRIGTTRGVPASHSTTPNRIYGVLPPSGRNRDELNPNLGRWPANVALDEAAAAMLDVQSGERRSGTHSRAKGQSINVYRGGWRAFQTPGHDETGGASRFFYVAKASRAERNAGLAGRPTRAVPMDGAGIGEGTDPAAPVVEQNHHPTVKPLALMRWLVRLVTPPGGLVLDPFTGSGTTGMAALLEGCRFVGVEQDADYCMIARARIAHAAGDDLPLFQAVGT